MKSFEILKPFEKESNPFHSDLFRMGTQIGNGPLVVMYDSHEDYKEVILVNTKTGGRVKITL